jgi:type IV secretion system protein TrbJ
MKTKPIVLLALAWSMSSASLALPVFDVANWAQNATLIKQQLDQYHNQLAQYKNMLDNSKSLTTYQWDDANHIINNLLETTDTLGYYKQQAGSLDNYLNQYQSQDYYQRNACFNGGCSKEEFQKIKKNQLTSSVAQKRANDAMLRGIDKQQQNLKQDSQKLRQLQKQAESVLIASQNAETARELDRANKEAIIAAGDERFREGVFRKSSGKKW